MRLTAIIVQALVSSLIIIGMLHEHLWGVAFFYLIRTTVLTVLLKKAFNADATLPSSDKKLSKVPTLLGISLLSDTVLIAYDIALSHSH